MTEVGGTQRLSTEGADQLSLAGVNDANLNELARITGARVAMRGDTLTVSAPTAEGLRVFEENRRQRNQWLAEVLADWPEEERHTLTRLLDRLISSIETSIPHVADQGSAQSKGADA